jgi:hypothetical protein
MLTIGLSRTLLFPKGGETVAKEPNDTETRELGQEYTPEGYPFCDKCGTTYKVRNVPYPANCPVCLDLDFFNDEEFINPLIRVLRQDVQELEKLTKYSLLASHCHYKKHMFDADKRVLTLTLEFQYGYIDIASQLDKLNKSGEMSVLFFNSNAVIK